MAAAPPQPEAPIENPVAGALVAALFVLLILGGFGVATAVAYDGLETYDDDKSHSEDGDHSDE